MEQLVAEGGDLHERLTKRGPDASRRRELLEAEFVAIDHAEHHAPKNPMAKLVQQPIQCSSSEHKVSETL